MLDRVNLSNLKLFLSIFTAYNINGMCERILIHVAIGFATTNIAVTDAWWRRKERTPCCVSYLITSWDSVANHKKDVRVDVLVLSVHLPTLRRTMNRQPVRRLRLQLLRLSGTGHSGHTVLWFTLASSPWQRATLLVMHDIVMVEWGSRVPSPWRERVTLRHGSYTGMVFTQKPHSTCM